MPRFKRTDYGLKFVPVDFSRQIIPGSFEHALCFPIDSGEVDLAGLEARLRNDGGGAPVYAPAVLLKIVLLAYSRGIVSSRAIEAACRSNVLHGRVRGQRPALQYGSRGSTASRCAGERRSMDNGSCTALCTTSRNWPIMAMGSEGAWIEAQATPSKGGQAPDTRDDDEVPG